MTVCCSHLDTCRGAFSITSSMKCQPAQHSIKTFYDRHVGLLALYIVWNKCVATPNTTCLSLPPDSVARSCYRTVVGYAVMQKLAQQDPRGCCIVCNANVAGLWLAPAPCPNTPTPAPTHTRTWLSCDVHSAARLICLHSVALLICGGNAAVDAQ
jgi:hypothetical protein